MENKSFGQNRMRICRDRREQGTNLGKGVAVIQKMKKEEKEDEEGGGEDGERDGEEGR